MFKIKGSRRFVLVDPSFDGKGGDKWQYALSFFDSAVKNGYEFVLLAHKSSPLIEPEVKTKVAQRNVFDAGFYMHGDVVGRHAKGKKRVALKSAEARVNEELARLDDKIAASRESRDFVGAQRLQEQREALLRRHIAESAPLWEEAERIEPIPTPFNRDDFAQALAAELLELKLGKGDVLFLHTATQAMLESLTEVSARLPNGEALDVDAYFLFHFGAEAPDARTFIDRYYSFSHFETLGLRLKSGSPFKRVRLLATNGKLRDELEAFFGLPVGLFEGLTNLDRYIHGLGGPSAHAELRARAAKSLAERDIVIGARIADLDEARIEALREAAQLLLRQGLRVTVRCAYHAGNKGKAVRLVAGIEDELSAFELHDTTEHRDYISFLASLTIAVLPYRPEIYKKRVSAVLHDCAVLGVSCVVPRGATLEDSREWADIYCYHEVEELPGVILRAATALMADPARAAALAPVAAKHFASDVISRLVGAMAAPSLTVERRGPIAVVIMPLWGRVGSSYAIEGQIRFLLERGYFVLQVFTLDKPVQLRDVIPWFWRMLYENSRMIRGSLQRIAYRESNADLLTLSEDASGFDFYLSNIAENSLRDDVAATLAKQAVVTVVNHVFNARFARRICAGKFILESHDVQSAQMAHWPLRNPFTGEAESYDALLNKELDEIKAFDFVINVSSAEHRQLALANPKSRVVTPYIPSNTRPQRFESVEAMAHAYGWDKSYYGKSKFDFLMIGDSHPANVESAMWFIQEAFLPYVSGSGCCLAIAGRLSSILMERLGAIGNIYYCGFVDDIADVRALSRIVVLPDQRGSGISIKTLETLAYGAPFVATSVAFRGLADRLSDPPRTYDAPKDFADRMIELLVDEGAQAEMASEAWDMYGRLSEKSIFEAAWREIFGSLGLPGGTARAR